SRSASADQRLVDFWVNVLMDRTAADQRQYFLADVECFLQRRSTGQDETAHAHLNKAIDTFGGLFVTADETERRTLAAQRAEAGPQTFVFELFDARAACHRYLPGADAVAAPHAA